MRSHLLDGLAVPGARAMPRRGCSFFEDSGSEWRAFGEQTFPSDVITSSHNLSLRYDYDYDYDLIQSNSFISIDSR